LTTTLTRHRQMKAPQEVVTPTVVTMNDHHILNINYLFLFVSFILPY
jgi:hypothetical protein